MKRATPSERFWRKVDQTGECWVYSGSINNNGYGIFGIRRNTAQLAHRFAYEDRVGTIPGGLQLDHLCRVRNCVNPAHLEPVTQRENMRRGESLATKNAAKTHCIHGHPFSPENTLWVKTPRGTPGRQCRECHRLRLRERRRAKAA